MAPDPRSAQTAFTSGVTRLESHGFSAGPTGTLRAHFAGVSAIALLRLSLLLPLSLSPSLPLPVWLAAAPPGEPRALLEVGERLLAGTDRGLYRWTGAGWSSVLARGGVRALDRTADAVLVATPRGLYRWPDAGSSSRFVPLGVGARVHGVAVDAAGAEWVATQVGLFVRRAGATRFERDRSLPPGEVHHVRATGDEVWVATRRRLWVSRGGAGFEPALAGLDDGWWELCGAVRLPEATLVCVPDGVWRVGGGQPLRLRPALGELRGLAVHAGRVLLASERGLFDLPVGGDFGAAGAVIDGDTRALGRGQPGVLVATANGVARISARPAAAPLRALPLRRQADGTPEIEKLRRAVLAYLELAPARIARLEMRARNAPLWPEVSATLRGARGRGRDREYDQSFSSGAVRDLLDVEAGHDSDLELRFELEWDLAELRHPSRALAISKERRELIELRDQVLERVHRLYFERLRVLARLAALGPESRDARVELELRSRELAAGLDAWSGGSFSRLHTASTLSQEEIGP